MKNFYLMVSTLMLTGMVSAEAAGIDTLRTQQLQDVQVISTRATKNTPMAFTNMTRDDIKAMNHGKDIPYILSLTPSVTMTSDAGNGIGYTTLRVRGTDPSRINITANGIPVNDCESHQVFWVNMGDFASSLQSIQIQRGVGTSTNGAGAFGATINMQTDNIGVKPYFGVDLSGGSYYSHKETVRFGTGLINGHWGLQGRLSDIGSKGYIDRASTKLNSYFLQGGYFSDNTVVKFVTWAGKEETYHAWDYTSKYEQSLYGRTFNSCGAMTWDNDKFYNNQKDFYNQQNYQLLLNQRLNDMLNLNVGLHYTHGEGYYEQYKIYTKLSTYGLQPSDQGNVKKADLIRQKRLNNDFYGAVASLVYDNKKDLEASFGGGWNKYDGDHYGKVTWTDISVIGMPGFEYYRNNSKKTDFNIYGKASYTLWKGLSAFVDLQYRRIRYEMQDPGDWYGANPDNRYIIDDVYNFFNPKFGLNYEITRNHRVYASYAIAHKEPTRDNYQDNQGLPLKAERLNDLEAGYKFQSEKFSAGANFYWMDYKDQFVLTGALNDIGQAVAINIPNTYRIGVELEAAWQPAEWFRWDINATFSRNRVNDAMVTLDDDKTNVNVGNTPLSFSPSRIFNNIFTFSYKGFKASVQSRAISKQYLTNSGFDTMTGWDAQGNKTQETITLGAHFTTNLDLSYNFSIKPWGIKDATVGVTMYNLFSSKYDTNGWATPSYKMENGKVVAYNGSYISDGAIRDQWAAGFAPSAPFNAMAYLSVNF